MKEGFEPKSASSDKEAIFLIEDEGKTVAILDYRLPDMDGFELLSIQYCLIPSILITSYGSKQLREEPQKAVFMPTLISLLVTEYLFVLFGKHSVMRPKPKLAKAN